MQTRRLRYLLDDAWNCWNKVRTWLSGGYLLSHGEPPHTRIPNNRYLGSPGPSGNLLVRVVASRNPVVELASLEPDRIGGTAAWQMLEGVKLPSLLWKFSDATRHPSQHLVTSDPQSMLNVITLKLQINMQNLMD
jgi:hypothetical protein